MAIGFFATLIIGLILSQLARISWLNWIDDIAQFMQNPLIIGAVIGVAISYGMNTNPIVIFSSVVTGAYGYSMGGPLGSYIAVVIGAELGNILAGRTKFDILLIPVITILTGFLAGRFAGPYIAVFMTNIGAWINTMTALNPLPMGAAVAVFMGMCLTMPITAAAIAVSLGLNGLAAGAATVGCAAQMVGFAVASYRDNGTSGLISQGIGTSMLQFPNILRRPQIWIPPIIASAILGPVAVMLFKMTNIPAGAGMGTSGLVGQFGTWSSMQGSEDKWVLIFKIIIMHFILPGVLTLAISEGMRKAGWIKPGDMAIGEMK